MTDTSNVDTTTTAAAAPTTSIFQNIENEVVTDVKEAVAEVEQFWTDDVKPILSAVLTYIEQNAVLAVAVTT